MPIASPLTMLLLTFLLLLAAILVAAARGFRVTYALLALNAALVYLLAAKPLMASDDRLGFGALVASALLVGFFVALIVGLIILVLRKKRADSRDNEIAPVIAGISIPILLFGYGTFSRWDGTLVFLLLGSIAVVSLEQAMFPSRAVSARLSPGIYRKICGTLAAVMVASIAFAFATAIVVAVEAKRIAGKRPFCLQSGYRAASSLLDLSLLTFRERYHSGNGPLFLRNHGLLVINEADVKGVLNWSYRGRTFTPDSLMSHPDPSARPKIVCMPQHHSA